MTVHTVPPRCRLLPDSIASGPWQMAADEVMLEGAIAGTAALRFYRWSEATLSLGYFQAEALRQTDPRLAKLPFVRRATGGATLVHHHELTYALALPEGAPWQQRGKSWLDRMHGIVAAALGRLGVAVKPVGPDETYKLSDVLCFLHQTPGDLLLQGRKIVGSAQRKSKGALLQHGAILLGQSVYTPDLPGLHELTDFSTIDYRRIEQEIVAVLRDETGWHLEPSEWTSGEIARREELVTGKYTRPSWTAKR